MFVTKKVFDPALVGKAARVTGFDVDGDKWDKIVLIQEANGEHIRVLDRSGEDYGIHMENFDDKDGLKLIILQEPQEQPKKTRIVEGRKQRTVEQAKKDSSEVTALLAAKGYALRLETVLKGMRSLGHKHWNNSNASSFMKQAIKHGAPIKRLERGVYVYEPQQVTVTLDGKEIAEQGNKFAEMVKRAKGVTV
jgi:hypothetical protein